MADTTTHNKEVSMIGKTASGYEFTIDDIQKAPNGNFLLLICETVDFNDALSNLANCGEITIEGYPEYKFLQSVSILKKGTHLAVKKE